MGAMTFETARQRADVIMEIRRFFSGLGYLEVDTPLLSPHLIPESSIEVFASTLLRPDGYRKDLYLVPSPEVWMKPLIAQGYGSIFQICKCFRNGEQQGRQHNSEFTMLEWYTVDSGSEENIGLTEELFRRLIPLGLPEYAYPPFRRLSVDQACEEYAGIVPTDYPEAEDLAEAARGLSLSPAAEETWESVFNRIFVQFVEGALPQDKPLVLYDYPARIPTLAAGRGDGRHSDRWELYAGGFECANCFAEETDYRRVESYFRQEAKAKAASPVPHAVNPRWTEMYRREHPRLSGVAMGVDRLIALTLGKTSIDGVIFFPLCDILDE
ncbi:MAG: elongation factor P--(R)-beta-lysine ligase [Spirochaetales bacterium]|nr:elongation factor P--(R)-beta-lysine ligase [Spirochaetales bacterium]